MVYYVMPTFVVKSNPDGSLERMTGQDKFEPANHLKKDLETVGTRVTKNVALEHFKRQAIQQAPKILRLLKK